MVEEAEKEYDKLVRAWCLKQKIDYDATVKNYFDHLGPPSQEREDPIPGADQDYTVFRIEIDYA